MGEVQMARLIIGILIVLAAAAFLIFLPNYKRAHADSDITYCHTNLKISAKLLT